MELNDKFYLQSSSAQPFVAFGFLDNPVSIYVLGDYNDTRIKMIRQIHKQQKDLQEIRSRGMPIKKRL